MLKQHKVLENECGLLEVLQPLELYMQEQLDKSELELPAFKDKTVIRFKSVTYATKFIKDFLYEHYIPKNKLHEKVKEAMKRGDVDSISKSFFPFGKSGPIRDGGKVLSEFLGIEKSKPNQETWLTVPNDKYLEVDEYLNYVILRKVTGKNIKIKND